ncbi:MAG: ACP S-malonyltransferase [Proteobacteria bacterium]|nr:ACP S-malonyltransferase [Pseudomonadota bacterium]
MHKTAFLFPGQGSQVVGMGRDFHEEYEFVRQLFDMVDDLCKKHVSRLCFFGPMEELTRTANLQPAICAVSLAVLAVLQKAGAGSPDATGGHSLGEYPALCAAGALSPEAVIRLVNRRGELMDQEAMANPGIMHAVLGLSLDEVAELTKRASKAGPVSVANHNTPSQVVISGAAPAVEKAGELARAAGARVIPLAVSGPWHSGLMARAGEEFADFLTDFPLVEPWVPVVPNVTAEPSTDPVVLADALARQITSPVRWVDSVRALEALGVDAWVEVGPKRVVSGMVKKIVPEDRGHRIFALGDMKSLEAWLQARA